MEVTKFCLVIILGISRHRIKIIGVLRLARGRRLRKKIDFYRLTLKFAKFQEHINWHISVDLQDIKNYYS